MIIHTLEMAVTTQVMLLSFFILADSYLFALDLIDGFQHHRIPLGLPSPYEMYPGMFDPPPRPPPIVHKDSGHRRPNRPPFTSESTTEKFTPQYIYNEVTTTENTSPKTEETDEDFNIEDSYIEREVFLMKNSKIPKATDALEETHRLPEANTLSIPEDSKLSVTLPENSIEDDSDFESNEMKEQESNGTVSDGISKSSDLILIPVNAVNDPSVLNIVPSTYTALTSNNNFGPILQNRDQDGQQSAILTNNVNAIPMQPNTVNNGATNNVYTILTAPNNQNQPNSYYVQPNAPEVYNLVSLNNLPTTINQPTTYAIINNQLVPVSNQPNLITLNGQTFVLNNQPLNLFPVNNQANNFASVNNNQPINLVPVNSQPNNVVPVNNQPNYIPINNQPNSFVSISTQPNNVVPVNDQSNNVILSNQPINFIPVNSVPSNLISLNNQPNSYVPASNNVVPVDSIPSNVVSISNEPNNYVSANLVPANNIPPISNSNANAPSNYSPNNVIILTAVATRDQDDDDVKKDDDVPLNNKKDEEDA